MTTMHLPLLTAEAVGTVAAAASLPAGRPVGSLLYAISEASLYVYNGSSWSAVAGGGGGGSVDSVNGQTGVVVLDTDDISEGASNLYFTSERVDDRVAALIQNGTGITWTYNDSGNTLTANVSLSAFSTSNLAEGSNLYYTDERVDDRVSLLIQNGTGLAWTYNDAGNTLTGNVTLAPFSTSNLAEGSNLYYTTARFDSALATKTTDNLSEGSTNLYYTASRFNSAFSAKTTDNLTEGSTNLYFTNARADARISAQRGVSNGIASLDAGGKVPASQLPNSVMEYQGTWNASTNTPTLADGTGNAGDVYIVSVAGTQNLGSGSISFSVADWVIYNGSIWQKSINSNAVVSVNSQTGVVVLTSDNISEGSTNLYFTNERVDDRVAALIQDGTGIAWTYNDAGNTLTANVSLSPFSTSNLAEGSNLYYTDEKVDDRVAALIQNGTGISWTYNDVSNTLTANVSLSAFSTSNLSEGSNLYYTDERVDDRVAALIQNGTGISWTYNDAGNTLTGDVSLASFSTTNLAEGTNLYYTSARFDSALATKTTDNLTEGSSNLYFTNARADARISAQKGASNGLATLDAGGKVPASQLPNSVMEYQGTWNASTNTPTLADGVGNAGDVYVVSVAGTQNLGSGAITFAVGDWALYSGSVWQKSTNSNAVVSVNGFTGVVSLTTSDISEGSNLYYTDERVDDRVAALLTAGSGISLTYNDAGNSLTVAGTAATNAAAGDVSTSAQSFAGLKKLEGGMSSQEYVGANPEVGGSSPFQLTNAHKRVQVINPSVPITVYLPSTSILAGESIKIVNRGSNAVTVASSDTTVKNILVRGHAVYRARINTPTAASDWYVEEGDSQHSVSLQGLNGNGASASTTQRYDVEQINVGSAVTYTSDGTNSTVWTINEPGIYAITGESARSDTGLNPIGITLNSSGPSTSIASLSVSEVLAFSAGTRLNDPVHVSWTGPLAIGDLIRIQHDGSGESAVNVGFLRATVTKVGHSPF